MRCGAPIALTPGSVTIKTRRTPKPVISSPPSSAAPGPNFSGGAPQVKIVSSAMVRPLHAPPAASNQGAHHPLGGLVHRAGGLAVVELADGRHVPGGAGAHEHRHDHAGAALGLGEVVAHQLRAG